MPKPLCIWGYCEAQGRWRAWTLGANRLLANGELKSPDGWHWHYTTPKQSWPMQDTGPGTVFFPVVGSARSGIASVNCRVSTRQGNAKSFLINGRMSDAVEDVLGDARFSEHSNTISQTIDVRFYPSNFSDQSFGLSLALADKLARFAPQVLVARQRIFCTGEILANGAGTVGKVELIAKKVQFILDAANAGDIVVFPESNRKDVSKGAEQALAEKGIALRFVSHLDDLSDLWLRPNTPEAQASADSNIYDSVSRKVSLKPALLFFLAAVFLSGAFFAFPPDSSNEDSVDRSTSSTGGQNCDRHVGDVPYPASIPLPKSLSEACIDAAQLSDRRLGQLIETYSKRLAEPNEKQTISLAQNLAALTALDRVRLTISDTEIAQIVFGANRMVHEIRQSDLRLAKLMTAYKALDRAENVSGWKSQIRLAKTVEALEDFDLMRVGNQQSVALSTGRNIIRQMKVFSLTFFAIEQLEEQIKRDTSPQNERRLERLRKGLSAFDQYLLRNGGR